MGSPRASEGKSGKERLRKGSESQQAGCEHVQAGAARACPVRCQGVPSCPQSPARFEASVWPGVPAPGSVPVRGPVTRNPLQVCFGAVLGGLFSFMSDLICVREGFQFLAVVMGQP